MRSLWVITGALLCALFGALWFAPAALAEESDKLETSMNAEQFRQAGLHRLTEAELAFLNQWLGRQPSDKSTAFGAEQLPFPEPAPTEPTEERTSIVGSFDGWTGRTVFTLANGQVWQQRLSGKYRYRKTENPEVVLIRGRFGYYLQLVASDRQIAVKRLK